MTNFRNENIPSSFQSSTNDVPTIRPMEPRSAVKSDENQDIHISEAAQLSSQRRSPNLLAVIVLLLIMDMV